MRTKDAAQKWGCTVNVVRSRCREGIVLGAYKDSFGKWIIPEEAVCPPMTLNGLLYLIEMILKVKEGASLNDLHFNYPNETVVRGYDFLISQGYVSGFNTRKFKSELAKARVLDSGMKLLKNTSTDRIPSINVKVEPHLSVVDLDL